MARLLSILVLILVVVLFPPAALALISNNAVPGDKAYPIKRSLEDIIYAVVSINPVTKAWFAKARSDRRFDEISVLFSQKKSTSVTIKELVSQTKVAAEEIKNLKSGTGKEQLAEKFNSSIQKYAQTLHEYSQESAAQVEEKPTPTPTLQPKSTTTPQPTSTPLPTPIIPTPIPTPEWISNDVDRDDCYYLWLVKFPPNWYEWGVCETAKNQIPTSSTSSTPSPTPTSQPDSAHSFRAPTVTATPTPSQTSTPKPTVTPSSYRAPEFKMDIPASESSATSSSNLEH